MNESELANRLRPYWLNDTARGSYLIPTDDSYDWGDGIYGTISSGLTTNLLYTVVQKAFTVNVVGATCPEATGATLTIYVDGAATITIAVATNVWTINGESAGSGATVLYTLLTPVPIAAGTVLRSALVTTATITGFGYSLGGVLD